MLPPFVSETSPIDTFPASAPPPPQSSEQPSSPPPSQPRFTTILSHPERSAVLLALLIGFASVLSAVIAWRASLASIDASRYESLVVQQQARQEQIEHEIEATVHQDLRFITEFQEHALAARELQAQADALRESDPDIADEIDLEAQARLALARAMRPFFLGATGVELDADGQVPYDEAFVMRNLRTGNIEWRELETTMPRTTALAQRADEKSLALIGVAALVVAALFFLTVAQVSQSRMRVRQLFFVAGALLVAFGTLAFALTEIVA